MTLGGHDGSGVILYLRALQREVLLGWGLLRYLLEPDQRHDAKDEPHGGHEPSRACKSVEYVVPKADLVQKAANEWAHGEAHAVSDDEPTRERRPPAYTRHPPVGEEALRVEEVRECDTEHHTSDEDEVEVVCSVRQAVEDVAYDGRDAVDKERYLVQT